MRFVTPHTRLTKAIKRSRRDLSTRSKAVEKRMVAKKVDKLVRQAYGSGLSGEAVRQWVHFKVKAEMAR